MTDFYNKLSEEDKHTGSPNSLWVRFRTVLETGIGKYIPHRSTSKRDRHPWMSQRSIYALSYVSIGLGNGLSSDVRQAIIWTNAGVFIVQWTLGNKFQLNLNQNTSM